MGKPQFELFRPLYSCLGSTMAPEAATLLPNSSRNTPRRNIMTDIVVGRNVCHGSDSVESANNEIALWFKDEEVIAWKSAQEGWIYE